VVKLLTVLVDPTTSLLTADRHTGFLKILTANESGSERMPTSLLFSSDDIGGDLGHSRARSVFKTPPWKQNVSYSKGIKLPAILNRTPPS
jgi:hypothetical protein